MSFFNIALNNIKKRFNSYLMYFVSVISSVTIFTLFCCIYFNPQFLEYKSGGNKMGLILQVSAIIVIIFSLIFVLYSNKFFLRERKKEIAIYSLLGMRKSQIGRMLFYENIIMGMLASIGGIILGTLFSRFFAMILFKLMATGTKVSFSIEIGAIVTPIITFCILFIISSINAYGIIYRYKLIDLLSASKQGEPIPKFSVWGGVVSILLIVAGYIISLKLNVNSGVAKFFIPCLLMMNLIIVGTVLFFKNFIPMIMVRIKENKHFYYKTSNFISTSQIVYRIKANSNILSIITILCAAAMVMTSGTYSMYHGLEDSVAYYAPYSYMVKNIDKTQYNNIVDTVNKIKITDINDFNLIETQIQNDNYCVEDVKIPGKAAKAFILSESDYKSIIKTTKAKIGSMNNIKTDFKGGLRDNECYFIDGNTDDKFNKGIKGSKVNVCFNNQTNSYEAIGVSLHKYIGSADLWKKPTIVVSDKIYGGYFKQAMNKDIAHFTGFMFDKPMNSESVVDELNKIVPKRIDVPNVPNVSHIGYYKAIFASYGVYTFIGLFLGILFIFALGSIMYYKQIIEAQEETMRYDILKKTGMNKNEVRTSIAKQLAIIFAFPLIIGLMHTLFAILVYNRAMNVLGKETPTLFNALILVVMFIIIYGFFYAISVKKYLQIVWNKK